MQNTKTQLHFIVGIGRSGTTILTKLLNMYKDIHCMPEAILFKESAIFYNNTLVLFFSVFFKEIFR